MVDRDRLEAVLRSLVEYRERLADLASRPRDTVASDFHLMGSLKYHLIAAIEACVDAAHHIIASEGLPKPKNMGDAFVVLAHAKVLDDSLSDVLKKMVGMRNVLVHQYDAVDDATILDVLYGRLSDFDAFAGALAAFLSGEH